MGGVKFPYEIKPAVKTAEYYAKYFKGQTDGHVEVGPKKYGLVKGYERIAETIYNMPVRPDDTFVVTFPRSGTTWTQELVWLIQNDMDFEKAKSMPLTDRYPFLEQSMFYFESTRKDLEAATDERVKRGLLYLATPATEVLATTPSPRFIKSHLPISLLPAKTLDTAKLVYVARDPRDVVVSYYHFTLSNRVLKYQGDFKAYFDQFIDDCVVWAPFLEHVKEGWELRDHPNVLFLFYEDLIKDITGCMRRVAQFFGKQYTDEQFAALADHLHIDNFKKNAAVDLKVLKDAGLFEGDFVRKGLIIVDVEVGPKKYVLPKGYEAIAEIIYNMPVRPDDTFVVSFPRSGTTWTQELVWLIKNDLDFEKAKSIPLTERYPFLEECMFHISHEKRDVETDEKKKEKLFQLATPATEVLATMASPRFIKTHLPISLLPPNALDTAKMVYVARDPRDVVVSNYHFTRSMVHLQYQGDFKAYFDQFIDGCVGWAPFLEHAKEGWELRDHPNVLFLFYEDLIKDIGGCMRRVAQFFGKQYTDEQFAALADHLHIDNFKKNAAVDLQTLRAAGVFQGEFVRKGKSRGWTEYLDQDMQARMDTWMQEGLRGSTLRFPAQ